MDSSKRVAHNRSSAHLEEAIVAAYAAGEPSTVIAKRFGVCVQTVFNMAKRAEVEGRSYSFGRNKFPLDESFFDDINCEDRAYWLGFIAADGAVFKSNALCIVLAEKDAEHLYRFAEAIKSGHAIKRFTRDGRGYVKFGFNSSHIAKSLSVLGVVPKKSRILTFPQLPSAVEHHFMRGYVDGDGCFYGSPTPAKTLNPGFNLTCASLQFAEEFQRVLAERCGLNNLPIRGGHGECWTVTYGGRHQIQRIVDYLYQDAHVYLARKHDKALSLLVPAGTYRDRLKLQPIP